MLTGRSFWEHGRPLYHRTSRPQTSPAETGGHQKIGFWLAEQVRNAVSLWFLEYSATLVRIQASEVNFSVLLVTLVAGGDLPLSLR